MQPQSYYTTVDAGGQTGQGDALAQIKQQVGRHLNVQKFKSNGYSKPLLCPFHDDKKPSASLHKDKGLHCFTCGKWFTWKELSYKLGIKWEFAKTQGESVKHRYLTDEIIQRLTQKRRVRACQVLSELYYQGYEGETLTKKDIIELAHCSHSVVDRMIQEGYFTSSLTPSYSTSVCVKDEVKFKRGRRAGYFYIPTLRELELILGCTSKRSYLLEMSDDVAELKAEVVSLPIKREPTKTKQVSAKYLGKAAGMKSHNTIRKYTKMVNDIEQDIESHTLTIAELNAMPETRKEQVTKYEKGSGWKYLEVRGLKYSYNKQQALALLRGEIVKTLEEITVYTRKANIYHYRGLSRMSEETAEKVRYLQTALIVSGARPEVLEGKAKPRPTFAELEAALDAKIAEQKQLEKQWKQKDTFVFQQSELQTVEV